MAELPTFDRRMSDAEGLMWRLEKDPYLSSAFANVTILDRAPDFDRLLARILEQGLDPEAYRWYLDLRKYGTFVHSGFGLGVERTVAWICGLPHIRETIAFPRQIHRLYP